VKPSEHKHRWAPPREGSPLDEGYVIFYTPKSHYLEFTVLEIESYDDAAFYFGQNHSPDPDIDDAPLMEGTLKWDGCMNVNIGRQGVVMVHFCGLDRALMLERAMRRLYALGAEHIEHWYDP
jgi:hypothetical protein